MSTIMCLRATSKSADSSKQRSTKVFTTPPTRMVMINKFNVNQIAHSLELHCCWRRLEQPSSMKPS